MARTARNKEKSRARLGDLLLQEGLVDAQQLQAAYDEQRRTGALLVQVLLSMGLVPETDLVQIMVKAQTAPYMPIRSYFIAEELLRLVTPKQIYQYFFFPLDRIGQVLTVVAGSFLDPNAISEIERATGFKVQVFTGVPSEVSEQIRAHYPDPPPREQLPSIDNQLSSLGGMLLGDEAPSKQSSPAEDTRQTIPQRKQQPEKKTESQLGSGMSSLGSMLLGEDDL